MGLDAYVSIPGPIPADEFEAGKERFAARDLGNQEGLTRDSEGNVYVETWARLWAPGYERGPWPDIHSWIMGLRFAFPGRRVYYGADFDQGSEADDELLAEYWAHWCGPHWNDYREHRNAAVFGG